jgi:hypothetical protein
MKFGDSVDTRSASPGERSAIVPLSLATVTVRDSEPVVRPAMSTARNWSRRRSVDLARGIPFPLVRRHDIDRA